jgi:hypothetical protein
MPCVLAWPLFSKRDQQPGILLMQMTCTQYFTLDHCRLPLKVINQVIHLDIGTLSVTDCTAKAEQCVICRVGTAALMPDA